MSGTKNSSLLRTIPVGGKDRQDAQHRYKIGFILWGIGTVLFIISCFVVHAHPKPYAIDLSTTQTVQGIHPFANWVNPALEFPSTLNNPLPSAIALYAWCGFMAVGALIFRLRHITTAAAHWLQAALFLLATVMSSAGINVLIDEVVGRPRPNSHIEPIHVYTPIVPFPSYPSGHTEHDIAYYGFLLYLSCTKPVRAWRYRWLLLPLQLYAVFDILAIGYSRILEGDHWLTDVLGGYFEGMLCLLFFIFLYRSITNYLVKRHARKAGLEA